MTNPICWTGGGCGNGQADRRKLEKKAGWFDPPDLPDLRDLPDLPDLTYPTYLTYTTHSYHMNRKPTRKVRGARIAVGCRNELPVATVIVSAAYLFIRLNPSPNNLILVP